MQLEELGFCGRGEAPGFIADGAIELGGRLPLNTHGGQLGEAYIHGMNGIAEARAPGPRHVGQPGRRRRARAGHRRHRRADQRPGALRLTRSRRRGGRGFARPEVGRVTSARRRRKGEFHDRRSPCLVLGDGPVRRPVSGPATVRGEGRRPRQRLLRQRRGLHGLHGGVRGRLQGRPGDRQRRAPARDDGCRRHGHQHRRRAHGLPGHRRRGQERPRQARRPGRLCRVRGPARSRRHTWCAGAGQDRHGRRRGPRQRREHGAAPAAAPGRRPARPHPTRCPTPASGGCPPTASISSPT